MLHRHQRDPGSASAGHFARRQPDTPVHAKSLKTVRKLRILRLDGIRRHSPFGRATTCAQPVSMMLLSYSIVKNRELPAGMNARTTNALKKGLLRTGAVLALLIAVMLGVHAELFDPVNVKELVLGFGPLAPVIWGLIYLIAVFIPYATTVMTLAAGLAFGTVPAAVLTFCITIFASLLPFTVSRRLGREWVEAAVGNTKVQKYVDLINRHALLVFFYLRLLPSLPYELQNHIAGVTRISYKQFLLASLLGNGPVVFILAFFGDSLSAPGSKQFWVAAAIYLAALLAPVLLTLARRRLGHTVFFKGLEP